MKTLLCLTLMTLASCSSTRETHNIREQVENSNVSDSKTLEVKINTLINKSSSLSEAQKEELKKIFEAKKLRSEELMEHSYKLRGVMVKELIAGSRNKKTIKILKKEIKQIEMLRLQNTFDTVDKISVLLDPPLEDEDIFEHLLIDRAIP